MVDDGEGLQCPAKPLPATVLAGGLFNLFPDLRGDKLTHRTRERFRTLCSPLCLFGRCPRGGSRTLCSHGTVLVSMGVLVKPRHDDKRRSHVLGQFPQAGPTPSPYQTTTPSTSDPNSSSALGGPCRAFRSRAPRPRPTPQKVPGGARSGRSSSSSGFDGSGLRSCLAREGAGPGMASGRSSSLGRWGLACPGVFFRLVGGGMASRSSAVEGSACGLISRRTGTRGRGEAASGRVSRRIDPSISIPSGSSKKDVSSSTITGAFLGRPALTIRSGQAVFSASICWSEIVEAGTASGLLIARIAAGETGWL